MNLLNSSKLISRSLIGAVGLSASAIALFGATEAAKAQLIPDILAGTDYLYTPANGQTFYDFGDDIGQVAFKGIPTFAGGTDTVVERLNDCVFDMGMCEVDYIIRDLNLMSIDPVEIPDVGAYNVFVMLDPNQMQDSGVMKILDDGTYTSDDWPVKWKATFEPIDNAQSIPDVTGTNFFDSVAMWSHEPLPGTPLVRGEDEDREANCHDPQGPGCDPRDFFITKPVLHTSDTELHEVVPILSVPEPSATVPLALFGLAGIWGVKKKQSLK